MDIKKLIRILIRIGSLITLGAFIWWAYFYGQITKEMKSNLGDAISCLYSSDGPCGFINGLAQFGGATPYNPIIFWVGITMVGIGIVLKLSVKKEN